MVTFTHTVSVFALGFVTLFLSRYVLPDQIYPVLGAISGLAIVWIGLSLLVHRARRLRGHAHPNHGHPHSHDHAYSHDHSHTHDHPHSHDQHGAHEHTHHRDHTHNHDHAHQHSHVPEEITMGSLIALAVSGGLVPCPSALVLLLSSVALGRVGFGLVLLLAFSAGLALVLMAIGLIVLYAKHLIPQGRAAQGFFRYAPVASAAVIVCVGLLMTGISLGVVRG
jgi:ABC-type nickel/cobalt efflux system permease component RcnA